jgi:hypothetical protein
VFRSFRQRPSAALIVAAVALVVSMTSGAFAGQSGHRTRSVKAHAARSFQHRVLSVIRHHLSRLQGLRGPQGPPGPPGTGGTQGRSGQSLTGAHAYGVVDRSAIAFRSAHVLATRNPYQGIVCIYLDSTVSTANSVLIASPNGRADDTTFTDGDDDQAIVEWVDGAGDCPAGNVMEVRTGDRYTLVDSAGTHDNIVPANEGFSFEVP